MQLDRNTDRQTMSVDQLKYFCSDDLIRKKPSPGLAGVFGANK
ncbi:MAG: hypothetical protein OFPI_05710 [Osedax symbiont Rs2]|nr:MAG: hypothetical protein OFPI_05710 [Osedax symbiont Rs2]